MPCYTIKRTTVDVEKMNPDILIEGLRAAGYEVIQNSSGAVLFRQGLTPWHVYEPKTNKLTLTGAAAKDTEAAVKVAYSGGVVRAMSKKFGWKLSEQKTGQFVATKRS